jgi:hypothetical protein
MAGKESKKPVLLLPKKGTKREPTSQRRGDTIKITGHSSPAIKST